MGIMLIVRLLIGGEWHALQTQFPTSRIELWNAPQFRLPSLHSVLITSAATNPIPTIATTINGQSTRSQKEAFQSNFSGVRFLFTLFSQAFGKRHFRKREIILECFGRTDGATVRRRPCLLETAVVLFRCDRGEPLHDRRESRIIS
jgi:hypothetical protein